MSVRWAASFVAVLALVGCRRSVPPAVRDAGVGASSTAVTVVPDGGSLAGTWSCTSSEADTVTLPRDAALGAVAFGAERGAAPLVAFVGEVDGVRRHAAVSFRAGATVLRGPEARGDAPPWTPFVGARGLGFVRLVAGANASWGLFEGSREVFTMPIELGDELAVDALEVDGLTIVAAAVSAGVDIRVVDGGAVRRGFQIEGGESPVILRRHDGSFAVAARVEGHVEDAPPVRRVPTTAMEGAGEERTRASLVVVDAGGKRIAAHALASGEELISVAGSRSHVVVAGRRIVKGQSVMDLARVDADGRRVRVAEVPTRHGARIVAVEGADGGAGGEFLELGHEGLWVLGERQGALPIGACDAVLVARAVDDRLEVLGSRETVDSLQVFRAVCRQENP